jgi:hypothetical protein
MIRRLIDRLGWCVAGAATLTLVLVLAGVVSAGPLDPSGPPSAPSGVFGAGTPISSLPYTISSPGSYYITGNLTGVIGQSGITIASHDVTLDLRGFTLQGVSTSIDGVRLQNGTFWRAVSIRNGTVRGWGESGINAQFSEGGVFDSLTAESNGSWGIIVGGIGGASLSRCTATRNGHSGISASETTITGCTSLWNAETGFQLYTSVLKDCVSAHNTMEGIHALSSRIEGCNVYQNTQIGINAEESDIVANRVAQNSGTGIEVAGLGSLVARNNVQSNSLTGTGYGINVTGTVSRVEENHVVDLGSFLKQDVGIRVVGGENIVINNSAHDNITNYDLSGPGGSYGPLQNAASATSPFANIEY